MVYLKECLLSHCITLGYITFFARTTKWRSQNSFGDRGEGIKGRKLKEVEKGSRPSASRGPTPFHEGGGEVRGRLWPFRGMGGPSPSSFLGFSNCPRFMTLLTLF